jgi:hypothetical protein
MERPLSCGHFAMSLNQIKVCVGRQLSSQNSQLTFYSELQAPTRVLQTQEHLMGCVRLVNEYGHRASFSSFELAFWSCSIRISANVSLRFFGFSAVPPGECPDSTAIRPRILPSKSFIIHLSIVLLFKDT